MNKKVDFDEYVDDYDQLLQESTSFFSQDVDYFAKYKIDLLKKYSTKSHITILEFGAGIGRNLPYLIKEFPTAEIWATDISKKSLDYIKEQYPQVKTFHVTDDVSNLYNYFDLIFIAGVYHHIEPKLRDGVTSNIYDLMKHQAELFIFEHNPYNIVTKKLVEQCIYDKDAVLLKPYEVKNLLMNTKLEYTNTIYYLFFPPKFKLGWLEKFLFFIPLGGQFMIKAQKQ